MKVFARAIALALMLVAVLAGQTLATDPVTLEAASSYTLTGSISAFDADGAEIKVTYFDRGGFDSLTEYDFGSGKIYKGVGPSGGPMLFTSPTFNIGCPYVQPFPYRTMLSASELATYDFCFPRQVLVDDSTPGVFGVIVAATQLVPRFNPLTGGIENETQVFDDWVVTNLDTDGSECHAGDVGLTTPNRPVWDEITPGYFNAGPEYRAWTDAVNDIGMRAKFEAHYARVFPDVSAPLFQFDEGIECAVVEQGDALPLTFSCQEPGGLGSGIDSCVVADRSGPVLSGESLDTSVLGTHTFTLTATDKAGNVRSRTMTYTVLEGSTTFDQATFYENQPAGTVAGTLVTSNQDAGDNWLYELVAGEGDSDNSLFTIDGTDVKAAAPFDFEDRNTFSIRVRVTDVDHGRSREYIFPVSLTDIPGDVVVSPHVVAENLPAGTLVGQLAVSGITRRVPYSVSLSTGPGDDDNDLFLADCAADSPTCELRTRVPLDFEGRSAYSIRLLADLPFNHPPEIIQNNVTIRLSDANDAPTDVTLSNQSIPEGSGPEFVVGTLAAVDQDAGDAHAFELVIGPGDDDNPLFEIDGTTLKARDSIADGTRSIRVRATDAAGATVEQTFTITVTDVNAAPDAVDDDVAVDEEGFLVYDAPGVLTNDTDADDEPLTARLVSGPAQKLFFSLGEDGTLRYLPPANFSGEDSFTYEACDLSDACDTATVRITVNGINDAPTGITLTPDSITEYAIDNARVGDLGAVDPDSGDTHTFELVAGAGDTDNERFAISGGELQAVDIGPWELGTTRSIRVRVTDEAGETFEQALTVNVININVPPFAGSDYFTTDEDVALDVSPARNLLANDGDSDSGDVIQPTGQAAADNGTFTVNSDGTFTYVPNPDFNGIDYAGYELCDQAGACSDGFVQITVNAVNDPVEVSPGTFATDEDTALQTELYLLYNDADLYSNAGDEHVVTIAKDPQHGTVSLAGTKATYTPAANYNGPDSYDYRVCDLAGSCASETVFITVRPVNDRPVADDDTYTVVGGTSLNVSAPGVLDGDSDVEGSPLTAVLVTGPAHGTLNLNANGSFSYTPAAAYIGSDSFTYKASDGSLESATATVSITVTDPNVAPVARNDSYSTNEDTALTITAANGVLKNDSDANNDTLTASLVSGPSNGTLTLNANGSFTYTPAANWNGSDSFTYKANDGKLDSDTKTVTITVNPVNDAPTIAITGGSCTSDANPSGTVTYRVADIDSSSLTVTAANPKNALLPAGSLSVDNAGRTVTVNAVATKNGGTVVVTLTVSDGSATGTTTVNVIVGTAKNETFTGTAGTDLIFGLAGTDTIAGAGAIDILCGGQGDDVLRGGDGDDVLNGLSGADTLEGNAGDDSLLGGGGNDILRGGDGNDTLRGQGGADAFTGGAGTDAYADFSTAEGDSQTEAP